MRPPRLLIGVGCLAAGLCASSAVASAAAPGVPTQVRLVAPSTAKSAGSGVAWAGNFAGPGTNAVAVESRLIGHAGAGTDWVGASTWRAGSTVVLNPGFGTQVSGTVGTNDPREASRDMNSGAIAGIGDFNGDGLDDALLDRCVVLGSRTRNRAFQLPSTADAIAACAPIAPTDQLPHFAAGAGDLDGDGLADAAVTYLGPAQAWVIFGRRTGEPSRTLQLSVPAGQRLRAAAGVGDVNGDGHDDLAVASSYGVQVIPGPLTPGTLDIAAPPPGTLSIPVANATSVFTNDLQALGDVNGDGLDDIGLATRTSFGYAVNPPSPAGDISQIIYGARPGAPNAITRIRWPGVSANLGTVAAAGDLDRDGLRDVVVAVPGKEQADVIYGRRDTPATIELRHLKTRDGYRVRSTSRSLTGGFGTAVAAAPPWIGAHSNGVLVSDGIKRIIIDTDHATISTRAQLTSRDLRVHVRCPNASRTTCTADLSANTSQCARYASHTRLTAGTVAAVSLAPRTQAAGHRCKPRATGTLRATHRTWAISQPIHISPTR